MTSVMALIKAASEKVATGVLRTEKGSVYVVHPDGVTRLYSPYAKAKNNAKSLMSETNQFLRFAGPREGELIGEAIHREYPLTRLMIPEDRAAGVLRLPGWGGDRNEFLGFRATDGRFYKDPEALRASGASPRFPVSKTPRMGASLVEGSLSKSFPAAFDVPEIGRQYVTGGAHVGHAVTAMGTLRPGVTVDDLLEIAARDGRGFERTLATELRRPAGPIVREGDSLLSKYTLRQLIEHLR